MTKRFIFHQKAFEMVWDMMPMTPAEHVEAFRNMLDRWERDKEAMARKVIMCSCQDWQQCQHPWPQMVQPEAGA